MKDLNEEQRDRLNGVGPRMNGLWRSSLPVDSMVDFRMNKKKNNRSRKRSNTVETRKVQFIHNKHLEVATIDKLADSLSWKIIRSLLELGSIVSLQGLSSRQSLSVMIIN